jgi:hypothetical protein
MTPRVLRCLNRGGLRLNTARSCLGGIAPILLCGIVDTPGSPHHRSYGLTEGWRHHERAARHARIAARLLRAGRPIVQLLMEAAALLVIDSFSSGGSGRSSRLNVIAAATRAVRGPRGLPSASEQDGCRRAETAPRTHHTSLDDMGVIGSSSTGATTPATDPGKCLRR